MSKILKDALKDAEVLKETAFESAKNTLVEAFSPQIKEFIDGEINRQSLQEMGDLGSLNPELLMKLLKMLQGDELNGLGGGDGLPTDGPSGPPDTHLGDEPTLDDVGPGEEEDEEVPEGMYENKEEDEDKEEDGDDKNMEEVVKITEADLVNAWNEVVKEEALEEAQVPSPHVAGEFGQVQNPNSLAKGGLGEKSAPGERGLEDKEKEKMWKDEVPPAAQDWTVKGEALQRQVKALRQENQKLKNENAQLTLGVKKLHRTLMEVNLFNSKLLHTNKLLQSVALTAEQRNSVIEAIDRAETLREVKLVYQSLSESLKIAGVLSESKARQSQRSSRFTTSATAKMLQEQGGASESGGGSDFASRMRELAGVIKD